MMSAFFYFQHTLNRLFNNCIKVILVLYKFFLKLLDNGSYTYACFLWILSIIKMKFGQVLVFYITNISNMFLAECWKLGTSSRLFYDFIKMPIYQDLAIFNGWYLRFLIVSYSSFQKNETLESWNNCNWVIRAGC